MSVPNNRQQWLKPRSTGPVSVTLLNAPSPSTTQTTVGTRSLRAQIKILVDNIAALFSYFTSGILKVANGGTGATDAAGARSALGLGAAALLGSPIPVANGGTGATTAAGVRSALDLGAAALLGSPIPVANGGTGATSAASARNNLGLTNIAYTSTAANIVTAGVCDVNDAGATVVDGICNIGFDGNKTDATDVTTDTVLWTIAAAYRPKATVQVPCTCKLANNTPRFRRAIISTDGTVRLNAGIGTAAFDCTVCAAYSVMA